MGQNISNQFEGIKDDVVKEAHVIKEIFEVSRENLREKISEANEILQHNSEGSNARLEFQIKEGSDESLFWKPTVKITCMKHSELAQKEAVYKELNLRQFLIGHKMILYHMTYKQSDDSNCAKAGISGDIAKQLSASMILDQITSGTKTDVEDCIICMERKPEITLPCAHAYCLFCIEQWNVSNKTCPVCREKVENTDDSWVTPDIPDSSEINAEVQKAVTELTVNFPDSND